MKTWKMHWDRQLYKALEHQYQMGLEALNENLPEIKVELVFRYNNKTDLFPCGIHEETTKYDVSLLPYFYYHN